MIFELICIIFWIFLLTLSFYYLEYFWNTKKSPPGPFPIPLLGNLLQVSSASPSSYLALAELAKQYGEIYHLRFGSSDTVVLSSLEANKQILNQEEALGRDLYGVLLDRSMGKELGMAFTSGDKWRSIRSWTVKNLKQFGFGKKSSTEFLARDEISHLISTLNEVADTDGVLDTNLIFNLSALNVVWRMMTGERISEKDERMQRLLKDQDACLKKGVLGVSLIYAYPSLRFIFSGLLGYDVVMKFYIGFIKTMKEITSEYRERKINFNESEPENLLEAFIRQMELEVNNPNTLFTEDNCAVLFLDLFQGGSETTGAFLEWIILFMILNPDKQKKLQEEIDATLPNFIPCTTALQDKMIYTQASILEAHRHAKVLPNGVPRKALNDIKYKNYIIKKGTVIMTDNHSINFDKDTWSPDPNVFRPERFISVDGKLIHSDKIIPFSIGKRNCPGEPLAVTTSFLFVVNLFQQFQFSCLSTKTRPTVEPAAGFSLRPQPYKVFVRRR